MSFKEMYNNLDPVVVERFWTTFVILITPFIIIQIKRVITKILDLRCKYWSNKAYDLKLKIDNEGKKELAPEHENIKAKALYYNSILEVIRYKFEIDNPWNSIVTTLYGIFWVVGGCIMTFVAGCWLLIGALEMLDQNSKLLEAQVNHNAIVSTLDAPNELILKEVEELNELFRRNSIYKKDFRIIDSKVIKDYKERLYIDENKVRAKVAEKWSVIEVIPKFMQKED